MKKLLFLSFFLFFFACQQNKSPEEKEIDKMLEEAKTMSDPSKTSRNMDTITSLYHKIEKKSEDIGYKKGIMLSSRHLMNIYFNFIEDPKKALEYSYKSEKYAKELKDGDILAQVHQLRGSAYLDLGFNKESYSEFQKAIAYYQKKQQHYRLHIAYQSLTIYYEKNKAPQDTILSSIHKTLQEIEAVKENDHDLPYSDSKYYQLSRTHMNMGMFYIGVYKPQQPKLAEEHLLKSLKILEDKKLKNVTNKLFVLNALGRFYENQRQPQKALQYANAALKLEKQAKQISERLTSFMVLANSYEAMSVQDSTLKYTQLYSHLSDSISYIQKKEANNTLTQISIQKEKKYQSHTQNIIAIALSAVLMIIASGWLYIKTRNKQIKRNYEKLLEKITVSQPLSGTIHKRHEVKKLPTIQISEETLSSILTKLERFENSDRYLKKNINLSSLAYHLTTNQRYLTEIIKVHKGKSFSNYINGLRIEYITRKLYEDLQYREYKISYLAEECGFASHQAFITVFKKETGVTPSYFIDSLKNLNQKVKS